MPPSNKPPDTASIKYTTLFIGLTITVLLLVVLFVVDKSNNFHIELSNYIELFSSGLVATGLIYTAISLQYNYIFHKERLEFDKTNNEKREKREDEILRTKKIQLTFEISSEWFKGDMAVNVERSRRFLQPYKEKLHDINMLNEFKTKLEEKEDQRRSLVSILNYFENVALLLERNVIDEDCTKDAFKALFCTYYKTLEPYINDIQRDSPRYFKSYTAIVKGWLL